MKKFTIVLMVSLLIAAMAISASAAMFEAAMGTPVVDGEKDDAYLAAKEIDISVEVAGNSDYATGKAYTLWDDEALYIFVDITDKVLTSSRTVDDIPSIWNTDSVEFYIDLDNTGDFALADVNAAQYTGGLMYESNEWGGSGMHWNANKDNCFYATKTTDKGWAIEAKLVWGSDYKPAVGNVIGFTLAVNDDADDASGRENQAFPTSAEQSNAWSMTGNYDDLKLTDAQYVPIVEEVAAPEEEAPAATEAPAAPVKAAQTSDMSIIIAIGTLLTSGAAILASKKRK